MPETADPGISRHRASAVEAVQSWLLEFDAGVRPLTKIELDRYRNRDLLMGWRVDVRAAGNESVQLDLVLDERFPRTEPRVALVPGTVDRVIPHSEADGVLCLFPSSASFAIAAPVDLVRDALQAAVQLVEDSLSGGNEENFRTEFLSYWTHHAPTTTPRVLSLLNTEPTTRPIRVWCGKSMCVAGESDSSVTEYLGRRFPKEAAGFETEAAVLLWLDRAPLPAEYPRTALDVLTLADRAGDTARQLLAEIVASAPKQAVVILGVPTERGPAFAAIVVGAPSRSASPGHRGADPLTAGFRPGRVPAGVISHRFFGPQQVRCADVDRVDPAWIHGRDADARFKTLQGARVAVLGCGSVGAPVAVALAQAGVGELMLVDPEVLASANIGRHVLGSEALGSNKATALAGHLRARFPHLKAVEPHALRWDEAARTDPKMIAACDLIVSTIGDWSAEGALNEWHVRQNRQLPIVYGWTEPHACAGHAVAVLPAGGCLQCGLTEFGEPLLRVTDWPAGPTVRQEPACGATYQPYGPVELMYVTALVAELTVDCLLGSVAASTERIWAARQALLESVGGAWTADWRGLVGDQVLGGRVAERPWSESVNCIECKGRRA